jgi:CHAT domain-containing protein/tetratricopeptide (TPR) repeat protein
VLPKESPDYPGRINNLSVVLAERFSQGGPPGDLQRALDLIREAATLTPDTPARFGYLSNLSSKLLQSFGTRGNLSDLRRGIEVLDNELAQVSKSSEEYRFLVHSLGIALSTSYDQTHDRGELRRAVAFLEEAVRLTPEKSPGLPDRLRHLSLALCDRFRYTGDLADLHRALEGMRRALDLLPEGSPHRYVYFDGLGMVLSARYERLRWLADLDPTAEQMYQADIEEAIKVFEQAVEAAPVDSGAIPAMLTNLAKSLRDRYEKLNDWPTGEQERAVDAYRTSCTRGLDVSPQSALRAAFQWSDWAASRGVWSEASEAYGYGQQALEVLVRLHALRRSKEVWLSFARGLPTLGAYALARIGDFRGAVEALEAGRAVLLAEALDRDRADLESLESIGQSALLERYRRVAQRYSRLLTDELRQADSFSGRTLIDASEAARAELDAVVAEVRKVPGYDEFQARYTFTDIRDAASSPLVYLTATKAGGFALIVYPHRVSDGLNEPGVEVLWLDALSEIRLLELWNEWSHAYDPIYRHSDPQVWREAVQRTTGILWDMAMGPVVRHLTERSISRAALIPVGLLGLLPLHAAWGEQDGQRLHALDQITWSYAPSGKAFMHAKNLARSITGDALLAVDEPQPTRNGPLYHSKLEVAAITSQFDGPLVLRHEDASRQAALEALPCVQVAHFSCHGGTNPNEPLKSGLAMADDEILTVSDVFGLQLRGARLAVLSACETGMIGTTLPDEVIGLPVALLQAGFAGVIASLWSVYQTSTAILMERFYRLWREDGMEPAEALRQAQMWLRDTTNEQKREYFVAAWFNNAVDTGLNQDVDIEFQMRSLLASWAKTQDDHEYAHPIHWAGFAYVGG